MSKSGGLPRVKRAGGSGGLRSSAARALVRSTCQQAVAGKLAVRQLAAWVRPFGIGETEFRLLWLVAGVGGNSAIDQAELAQRLAVSAAQVSAVVERLRAAGLVEGDRLSRDRRRQCWRLTSQGLSLIEAVVTKVAASEVPAAARPVAGIELSEDAA